jgi:N-acetyltransferase 10
MRDRQTTNDLTGEHSCIMLHILDTSDSSDDSERDEAKKGLWLAEFWTDFRRRFISLLGMQFRSFSPALALSVLQNKVYKQELIG